MRIFGANNNLMDFYLDQLQKLNTSSTPLPAVKFKDNSGYSSTWMHLTPECIHAIEKYFTEITSTHENITAGH